ncbi:MAG: SCP2 sterol-binding domain-containing protein [Solirubrobacterales bacterium]|nr:SCP2 sterol-binding domain-containing protein [Solirubrobacterales bacterium]
MAELTSEFFLQAATDERLGSRLALAQTTVHIHFNDDIGVTLRLDKTPIEAEPQIIGTAEVEIWGSADRFLTFALGQTHMSMAIMRGEIEYQGPVRKFLRIMPMLRSFDGSVWKRARPDEVPDELTG